MTNIPEELVRDLTSVVPRPKSEVRKRLTDLLEAQRTRIVEKLEGMKKARLSSFERSYMNGLDIGTRDGYNQAISDAIAAVKEGHV